MTSEREDVDNFLRKYRCRHDMGISDFGESENDDIDLMRALDMANHKYKLSSEEKSEYNSSTSKEKSEYNNSTSDIIDKTI